MAELWPQQVEAQGRAHPENDDVRFGRASGKHLQAIDSLSAGEGVGLWDWLLARFIDPEEDGRRFDARYGTETCWYDLFNYEPTPPRLVEEVLSALPVEPKTLSFVDLGSGKGRVVLLASRLPFRRVVGIEHRPKLHAVAESNKQIFERSGEALCPIHLLCGDAANQPLPEGPLALWLFNPFGADVLMPLLARLQEREVYLLYLVPVERPLLSASGFRLRAAGGGEQWPWVILSR